MKRQSVFAAIMVFAMAASAAAEVKFKEPTGFGKAKFGMSVADVRKVYPQMQATKGTEQVAGKGGEAFLLIFELDNQSVGPLKPCKAELRFFQNELYAVNFRCPDKVQVQQYLQKTYGLPTKTTERSAFWIGEHGAVSLSPSSGAFGFSDVKRGKAMQTVLFQYVQKGQADAAATATAAAPPPGNTPTPAAPAHE